MSRAHLLLLALVGIVAAGCVTPATNVDPESVTGTIPAGWWENAIPSSLTDEKHDHAKRADHAGITTSNFEVLGWDPLTTEAYGTTLTGMGCGGAITREDGMRLAIVHSISTDVSFVVADITDPTAPKMMGEFYMPNAVIWDADISADGQHVLVGAYPYAIFGGPVPVLPGQAAASTPQVPGLSIQFRSACTGKVSEVGPINYLPFGPGIVMIGVQDPSNPTFEDWISQPAVGPHSVGSQLIDGKVYATSSVTNLVHSASYYTIFEIVGSKLVPYTVIRTPGTPPPTELNGHTDVFLAKHPVTGQLLAYLANWDGMYIYDISTPVPQELSSWYDAGNLHTTYPFPTTIGDKVYMLAGQEVGEPTDLPSGWVYILDITDPTIPTEVGRWTIPVKPKWDDGGLQFSPHYVAILNQTMFVANYHGGMWAVDISDLAHPQAIGIFVPERESPTNFDGAESYGPSIEDVVVDEATGLLTTWDNSGGVYTMRFHDEMASVKAPAWPGSEPGAKSS
ncbi:MAG TPA: hypothetical protein VM370_11490 [Candidatus Thermoplasmatota archaeon]|nr:hypothetical protein [Candidatus Thermoplasmatota archaeon]